MINQIKPINNKRGILGEAIQSPFILIMVFVITVIFLSLSFAATALRGQEPTIASVPELKQNNLLLKTIKIQNIEENGNTINNNLLVIEAIVQLLDNKITLNQFNSAIIDFGESSNYCYYISGSKSTLIPTEGGGYEEEIGFFISQSNFDIVKDSPEILSSPINSKGKTIIIDHYLGSCPNE